MAGPSGIFYKILITILLISSVIMSLMVSVLLFHAGIGAYPEAHQCGSPAFAPFQPAATPLDISTASPSFPNVAGGNNDVALLTDLYRCVSWTPAQCHKNLDQIFGWLFLIVTVVIAIYAVLKAFYMFRSQDNLSKSYRERFYYGEEILWSIVLFVAVSSAITFITVLQHDSTEKITAFRCGWSHGNQILILILVLWVLLYLSYKAIFFYHSMDPAYESAYEVAVCFHFYCSMILFSHMFISLQATESASNTQSGVR